MSVCVCLCDCVCVCVCVCVSVCLSVCVRSPQWWEFLMALRGGVDVMRVNEDASVLRERVHVCVCVSVCVCVCVISSVVGVSDGSQRRGRCNESE